jgi:hypothetical protein
MCENCNNWQEMCNNKPNKWFYLCIENLFTSYPIVMGITKNN